MRIVLVASFAFFNLLSLDSKAYANDLKELFPKLDNYTKQLKERSATTEKAQSIYGQLTGDVQKTYDGQKEGSLADESERYLFFELAVIRSSMDFMGLVDSKSECTLKLPSLRQRLAVLQMPELPPDHQKIFDFFKAYCSRL